MDFEEFEKIGHQIFDIRQKYEDQYISNKISEIKKQIDVFTLKKLSLDTSIYYLNQELIRYQNRDEETLKMIYHLVNDFIEPNISILKH
jgi:hypothetical protein